MPRRVRALVALAALAGCSLAGSGGNANCTNSCYCSSSTVHTRPAPSRDTEFLISVPLPPRFTRRRRAATDDDLFGAAPWEECTETCTPFRAVYEAINGEQCGKSVTSIIKLEWKKGARNFSVNDTVLGGDPCAKRTKQLSITTGRGVQLTDVYNSSKLRFFFHDHFAVFKEAEVATNPCIFKLGCVIYDATYSAVDNTSCSKDVTDIIRTRFVEWERFLTVGNDVLGGDPCPNQTKRLNIYTWRAITEDEAWAETADMLFNETSDVIFIHNTHEALEGKTVQTNCCPP